MGTYEKGEERRTKKQQSEIFRISQKSLTLTH